MPLTPWRGAHHTGQHQMDDVLGHVVLTVGDENFGAKHLVGTIRLCGSALVRTKARWSPLGGSVRFIEPVHSPAGDQLLQVGGFQHIAARRQQRLHGAIRSATGTARKADVGGIKHLDTRRANRFWQALPAKIGRMLPDLASRLP